MFGFAVRQRDGSYHINGLSAGSYTVQFDDVEDRYLTEWYDNAYCRGVGDTGGGR